MESQHHRALLRTITVLGILCTTGFLVGHWSHCYTLRVLTKGVPVACMAATIRLCSNHNRYAQGITAGLCFSVVGDVLLEISKSLFVAGLAAFLVAHLCYISAFLSVTKQWVLARFFPFIVWGGSMFWLLYPNLGKVAVPVGAYILVISAMQWRASACVGERCASQVYPSLALVGAILFAASDSLIAWNRFIEPLAGSRYFIILWYWLGQLCITQSAWNVVPVFVTTTQQQKKRT